MTARVAAAAALLLLLGADPALGFVPFGSDWRFLDDGSDAGTEWREPGFDDAAWSSGPAPLGYGSGDEATVLDGGPPTDRYITTWLRHAFEAPDPSSAGPLTLSLLRDDGAIVYLNGSEVARTNLPAGPVDFETLAEAEVALEEETRVFRFCLPPSVLVEGTNLLAVELHQADPAGADLRLDVALHDTAPALEREPYLQGGTDVRMIVRWRTDTCSDARLRVGTTEGAPSEQIDDAALAIDHEVEVTGLAPATRYYYDVGTSAGPLAGGGPEHFFRTSPPPGERRPMRIWVLGDSGGCGSNQNGCNQVGAVRDAFVGFAGADAADLVVMVGDNAYPAGSDASYTTGLFEVFPEVLRSSVLWTAPGNHEFGYADSPTQTGAYYDAFTLPTLAEAGGVASGTEAFYSFDYANVHFVSLDSHDTDRSAPHDPVADVCAPGQGGLMYQWLCADLAATAQEFVIVFWHHPPYSKGSHDSDFDDSGGRQTQMRERFVPVLEHYGVDLQLTGHSHSYERSFLVDGHYGDSSTYDPLLHAVDGGDGDPAGDGPYQKATLGHAAHEGAIYSVIGSSSRTAPGSFDHPIMVVGMDVLGSVVLDVAGRSLEGRFLDDAGTVRDHFQVLKGPALPVCDDGLDNDGDGLFDAAEDPGCGGMAAYHLEAPQCDDGLDNDGDGAVDWDGGGVTDPDPECVAETWLNRERGRACGLGFEVAPALLLAGASLARARRRRAARTWDGPARGACRAVRPRRGYSPTTTW